MGWGKESCSEGRDGDDGGIKENGRKMVGKREKGKGGGAEEDAEMEKKKKESKEMCR